MAGPYKQQNNGTLGASTTCPACPPDSTQISLCYSNVSADDLCCGSPVQRNVYIASGTTWETAPGYFQDSNLTTPAANGFYSGDIVGCGAGPGPLPANYSGVICGSGTNVIIDQSVGCDANLLTAPFLNLSNGQVILAAPGPAGGAGSCSNSVCVEITGITFADATYFIDDSSGPFNSCLTCNNP